MSEPGPLLLVLIDALPYTYLRSMGFDWAQRDRPLVPGLGYSITQKAELLVGRTPDALGYFNHWQVRDAAPVQLTGIRRGFSWLRSSAPLAERLLWKVAGKLSVGQMNVPPDMWGRFYEWPDGYYDEVVGSLFASGRWTKIIGDYRKEGLNDLATVAEALRVAREGAQSQHLFVSLAELDAIGHRYGASSRRFVEHGRSVSEALEELCRTWTTRWGGAAVLFSDHGMVDVARSIRLDPKLFDIDGRSRAVYWIDSTIVRVWAPQEYIDSLVGRLSDRGVQVLSQVARDNLGVGRVWCGDILGVAPIGAMFAPNFFGARPAAGMHGYLPSEPQHFGSVLDVIGTMTWSDMVSTSEFYKNARGHVSLRPSDR